MEHQKKDDEDPFVLRTVCYAGQLQFIEVLKSNESGSVTYQDFLESCKYGEFYNSSICSDSVYIINTFV